MQNMKKFTKISLILFWVLFTSACFGEEKEVSVETEVEYVMADLFCDVEFWKAPIWDTTEGSVMGEISKQTGLALDIEVTLQDAGTQMSLMLLNDTMPDIISVVDPTVISQLVSSGKVWKLDEFMQQYKPDSHLLKEFPEDTLYELKKRDGGWYAYPSHIESEDCREIWPLKWNCYEQYTNYGSNSVMIWNRELLELAGLQAEDIQTESQVLAALEKVQNMKLKVNDQEVIELLMDGSNYNQAAMEYIFNTFGVEYVDDSGNYTDAYMQPETKEALSFINRLVREQYVDVEQFKYDNAQIKKLIAEKRVLCFIGNLANTDYNPVDWVSTGVILADCGTVPVFGRTTRATCGWINTFIAKDCEHPEQIAEFIDFMTDDTGYLLWRYGFEGIHYYLDEDGCVIVTDEGKTAAAQYNQTGVGAWWMFENTARGRSIMPNIEKGSSREMNMEHATKYGTHESVKIYDSSLLNVPARFYSENEQLHQIYQNIIDWKKEQVIKVILASDGVSFEQEYQKLIEGLENREIDRLNAALNENYKENCTEYGGFIPKYNRASDQTLSDDAM